MPKILKAFKLTEKNIATIQEHKELMRIDNESIALRDILDNAHLHRQWMRLEILKHWNSLESLGITIENVRIVIPSILGEIPESKTSTKVRKKIKDMTGEIDI